MKQILITTIKTYYLFLFSTISLLVTSYVKYNHASYNLEWLSLACLIIMLSVMIYDIWKKITFNELDINFIGVLTIILLFYFKFYFQSILLLFLITLYPIIELILIKILSTGSNDQQATIMANLIFKNKQTLVDAMALKENDKIIIDMGEKVPVDCRIIEGSSFFHEQLNLNNRELISEKTVNDVLFLGEINTSHKVTAKVIKTYQKSYLSIKNELNNKILEQKSFLSTRIINNSFVYSLILLAFAFLLLAFNKNHLTFLKVLLISSPYLIFIPAKTGYTAGIKSIIQIGISIKSINIIEKLVNAKTLIFSKNGILTSDHQSIEKIITFNDFTENQIISIIGSLEIESKHKIATVIKQEIIKRNIKLLKIKNIVIKNNTLQANYRNTSYEIGSESILGLDNKSIANKYLINSSSLYVLVNKKLVGIVIFKEELTKNSKKIIKYFKKYFKKIVIITGDNKKNTENLAKKLSVSEFYFNQTIKDKLQIIENVKQRPVVFIGDHLYDSTLYQRADISIDHSKTFTELDNNPADIIITSDNLDEVYAIHRIAKKILLNMNIIFLLSIIVNILFLGIGLLNKISIDQALMIQPIMVLIVISIIIVNNKIINFN